ncbi:MAG: ComF family protein [Cytophagaceae bacterium]|nr:ComF family protein [Cytophagaceae bacterium]
MSLTSYYMIHDFISLIFPDNCAACDEVLYKGEQSLCAACRVNLPLTNYHLDNENPLMKRFWGRVPVDHALAYYKFTKGGQVQQILYKIKYDGMKSVARQLGVWYGYDLLKAGFDKKVDLLVPVPLHPRKQCQRGYNQSAFFAEGLSVSLNLANYTSVLSRVSDKSSQTLKSRFERWLNVKDLYKIKDKSFIENKHVLLCDDVITTGATIEACARELLDHGAKQVSVAAIAAAE